MADKQGVQREMLERLSRAVEANPGADERTIRKRAGVTRQVGDAFLDLLLRAGFIARERVNAEWQYKSVKPYRVSAQAPRPKFGSSHSTRQGGT